MTELFTAILIVITGFYAWVTFRILKANEKVVDQMRTQQEAMYRPYVSISPALFPENSVFFLKIRNSGLTAAQNLRLSLDKNFYQFGEKKEEKNLRSFMAFKEAVDSFVPGAEMLFYLAQTFTVLGKEADENLTPSVFTITAEYEYQDRKVIEKTLLDLRPYADSARPHDPIVNQLKELRETIKKK